MRDLSEIIEDCKLNKEVDNKELQYAVIALTSLVNMASSKLVKFYGDAKPLDKMHVENFQHAFYTALNKSPKKWLGWNNDPENPEYQKFHAIGTKLIDKALKGELPNQKKKVPQECYEKFGKDLDGCSTQENEGCGKCPLYLKKGD